MKEITMGSLFDGIGGWPLAAGKVGITPIWASEIEPFPITVTKKHFPLMVHLGDITAIKGNEIEPVDLVTLGSPCQDLSVAGKREGLDGKRSSLFMEAVRIIREMKEATNGEYPRFMVWENVPGAFSSNKGADFRTVLEEITESKISIPKSGRWGGGAGLVRGNGIEIAWRVLDAQYWGVPQRRKRIFLVADFTGQCAGKILFKPEGLRWHIAESAATRERVAGNAETSARKSSNVAYSFDSLSSNSMKSSNPHSGCRQVDISKCIDTTYPCPSKNQGGMAVLETEIWDMTHANEIMCPVMGGKVQTLNARMGTGGNQVPVISYSIAGNTIDRKIKNGGNGKGVNKEVSFTLNTIDRHAVTCAYGNEENDEVANTLLAKGNLSYRRDMDNLAVTTVDVRNLNENKELSGTLQSKSNGGYSLNYQNPVRVGYKVRRLTPTECERLQGLPDGWTAGGSDTQEYKALGNGMAQPCPDYVMQGVAEVLNNDGAL